MRAIQESVSSIKRIREPLCPLLFRLIPGGHKIVREFSQTAEKRIPNPLVGAEQRHFLILDLDILSLKTELFRESYGLGFDRFGIV